MIFVAVSFAVEPYDVRCILRVLEKSVVSKNFARLANCSLHG